MPFLRTLLFLVALAPVEARAAPPARRHLRGDGCIHGLSFSSRVPGRKPISFPIEIVGASDH